MQATLSKAAIYTKQPSREWGDPYLTWGCANVLLKLYETERSNVLLLNMYESLWVSVTIVERGCVRVVERGSVRVIEVLGFKLLKVWELLMFCSLAEGVRVFYCYFSLNTSQNNQQESWVSETSLFVILIFTDTSQNRQNILLLFF